MAKFPKKLQLKLEKRSGENALRSLPKSSDRVDFSSNDYLGFARNDELTKITSEFLKTRGLSISGSSGSRLLTGNHVLYQELEDFLTNYHNEEAALVFNSGYDANIGFFSSVPQRGDVILYDELVHASIRDGITMSNAKSYKFRHNDVKDLEKKAVSLLQGQSKDQECEIYVATESVFSMDGDSPDLVALADFCNENGYQLVVDEAHATGIYGEGRDMTCQLGLEENVFSRVITFGKALGNHGAAILGSNDLKHYLVNFARSLMYTTALPPHTVASVLVAYRYLQKEGKETRDTLNENIEHFKKVTIAEGLEEHFIQSSSAIHSLVIPGNGKVKQLASELQIEGFDVKPILSPTVKEGEERLRICLHAYNTKEEINQVLSLIKTKIK